MINVRPAIKGVFCAEPRRDGEYPIAHVVGYDGVTEITESQENLGTYGIHWFHVWKDGVEVSRVNATGVVSVDLFPLPAGGAV